MIRRAVTKAPVLETVVFVIAVGLLAAILYAERAQAPPPIDSYSSYDAAGGGYEALYDVLQRERVPVERFEQRPLFLDGSFATLVYTEPLPFDPSQGTATEADARAIEAWVKAGGTLLYFGHDEEAAKKKLLHLPFSRRAARRPGAARIAATLRAADVTALGSSLSRLRWKTNAALGVLFDDGRGPVTVAYPVGRGHVVATIDETFLDNKNVATADRARMALALFARPPAHGRVWFYETVHGHAIAEHWWSIVPVPFVYATALAIVALLIALAGAAVRFGPAIVPPARDDRTSADFIDALSTLLERGKASHEAVADAAASASHAVARSLGLAADASPHDIAARIDDQERRAGFETMTALANDPKLSETGFVRAIALAQRLRKDAVTHGR